MPRHRQIPRPIAVVLGLALLVVPLVRAADESGPEQRRLRLYHTHTKEEIDVVYRDTDGYVAGALERLDHFLRDFRNDEQTPIDPAVFDFLWKLARAAGNPDGIFEIISCYRSPETNAMLRRRSSGVAQNSQHLQGKAIDVRLRGTNTRRLRDAALGLRLGGVGYYKKSDFVHVDTGRVRRW